MVRTAQVGALPQAANLTLNADLAKIVEGIAFGFDTEPASNITLSFEEYDRTPTEKAGEPKPEPGHTVCSETPSST